MYRLICALTSIVIFYSLPIGAQQGVLDPSFNGNGIVTIDFDGHDQGNAVVLQPDGKILVGGGSDIGFSVLRFNSDGSADSAFGYMGRTATALTFGEITSMALQPDGKILAAGSFQNGSDDDIAVARYLPNGLPDSTFNHNGFVVSRPSGSNHDYAEGMVLQPDGKIVIAGSATPNSNRDFCLIRYNDDGSLDTSFNHTGTLILSITNSGDGATALDIQSDGKLVAAGYSSYTDLTIIRLNPDGGLDNSFSNDGMEILSVPPYDSFIPRAVAVQGDNKIAIAGGVGLGSSGYLALARFNSDGTLDTSFDLDGKLIPSTTTFENTWLNGLEIQPDKKLVAVGYIYDSGQNFLVIRLNPDGSFDSTFSMDGVVITPIDPHSNTSEYANGVALQQNGRVVVVGTASNGSNNDFAVVRYLSEFSIGILPTAAAMQQWIFPNPIIDRAVLDYSLQDPALVTIELWDLNGRLLKSYVENERRQAGNHQQEITMPPYLPAGNYLVKVSTPESQAAIMVNH